MREASLASTGPSVTDILTSRSREADGLSRMVLYSLLAHVLLVAALALVPGTWFGTEEPRERVVMSISLNGLPGPDTGAGAVPPTLVAASRSARSTTFWYWPPISCSVLLART